MTDKPQTLGEQIRAMEPQVVDGPVGPREAWEAARNQAAHLADAAATTTPVVVAEQAGDVRQAVRVKPLVWECVGWSSGDGIRGENDDTWEAYAVSDESPYVIEWHGGGNFLITPPVGPNLKASTLPSAKAAAQADYTTRITAALEPDPTPALGWKAMQTAAAELIRSTAYTTSVDRRKLEPVRQSQIGADMHHATIADAILALPGPSDEQALADAVKLPQWQAMVEAVGKLRRILTPLAMEIGYAELGGHEFAPDDVVASFMGGGGSDIVTFAMFQEADEFSRAVLAQIGGAA